MAGIYWYEGSRLAGWSVSAGPKGAVVTVKIAASVDDVGMLTHSRSRIDEAQKAEAAPKRRPKPLLLEDRRGEVSDG